MKGLSNSQVDGVDAHTADAKPTVLIFGASEVYKDLGTLIPTQMGMGAQNTCPFQSISSETPRSLIGGYQNSRLLIEGSQNNHSYTEGLLKPWRVRYNQLIAKDITGWDIILLRPNMRSQYTGKTFFVDVIHIKNGQGRYKI